MDRRYFLHSLGLAGAAGLLAACGGGTRTGTSAPTAPAAGPSSAAPQMSQIVDRVAPDAEESLSVINASFEQLTGKGQPFAFGVTSAADNEPVTDADLDLFVVPPQGEAAGPFPTRFTQVPGVPLGLYVTEVDLSHAGPTSFVAVTKDGSQAGLAAVQVVRPQDSQVPAPGQKAISVPTATKKNQRGVAALCTATPPCSMHDVSLDSALRQGRPAMLTFATPQYCQTAVCGPSVETIDAVRQRGEWGDVAWIHVEIYADQGQTLAPPVQQWGLPSEPWLFTIGADGMITDRADGPLLVLPEQVDAMAKRLA